MDTEQKGPIFRGYSPTKVLFYLCLYFKVIKSNNMQHIVIKAKHKLLAVLTFNIIK